MSKLTKKQLINGIKFMTKFDHSTIFTVNKSSNSITSDILFSCKKLAITDNQYAIESITDKYLKMWDINFGQKKTYRIKLTDIEIVETEYNYI